MRPTIFKHRRRYGGGNTSSRVASGMQSVETHVQLSFGWTHEDLWLRVYRKSVVAVPVEVAPRAQRCRVKGQSTFDRIRQPQTKYLTQFYLFNTKLLEGSCTNFIIPQLFSKQILLPDYLRVTSMNSIHYQQSELSVILEAHNLKQQSSESRKIRGEADVISTQRPFSKFEFSHLFLRCWSVSASPTPGEQNRWRLFSIWTAIFSPTLSMLTNDYYFYRRSQQTY